jgi:hypothetical protein
MAGSSDFRTRELEQIHKSCEPPIFIHELVEAPTLQLYDS